jgi:magnesium transporter
MLVSYSSHGVRSGDLASKIRDSLLGIGRIVPFVLSLAAEWLPAGVKLRLETLRQDVGSLNDYDTHPVNKLVSLVGVPPTLVASMYGMNLRHMPELDWRGVIPMVSQ